MKIHLNIKITGRVQRVGFRNFALQTANELSIKGFVCNQSDGSVYAEAEGTQMQIDEFLEWCYKGSPMAKVDKIDIQPGDLKGFTGFEIKR